MKESEIEQLIDLNPDDKLSFYLTNLLSKSKEIEKENNMLGIMMLVLILLYYLIENTKAGSLNIGPISIKDVASIISFIPLVFAFLILRYTLINSHKAELIRIVKKFSSKYFSYENSNIDIAFTDDFTRTLLPISIYEEFNKLNYKGTSKIGCIGAILTFPLSIGLTVAPYYLEYIWIKELIERYSVLNYIEKISILGTIWILLLSIYYLIHTMVITVKENK